VRCGYLDDANSKELEQAYEHILGKLVNMMSHPEQWAIRTVREEQEVYDQLFHEG
jgi:hypothetical protein